MFVEEAYGSIRKPTDLPTRPLTGAYPATPDAVVCSPGRAEAMMTATDRQVGHVIGALVVCLLIGLTVSTLL